MLKISCWKFCAVNIKAKINQVIKSHKRKTSLLSLSQRFLSSLHGMSGRASANWEDTLVLLNFEVKLRRSFKLQFQAVMCPGLSLHCSGSSFCWHSLKTQSGHAAQQESPGPSAKPSSQTCTQPENHLSFLKISSHYILNSPTDKGSIIGLTVHMGNEA